jgi:integrase
MFGMQLRVVGDTPDASPAELIEQFTARYANQTTRKGYRRDLTMLFAATGARHPSEFTEQMVFPWCVKRLDGGQLANNSVRARKTALTSFLRWCQRSGIPCLNPDVLTAHDSPLWNQSRPTAGKVQAPHPARWLSEEEAFVLLIGACQTDNTIVGLRDEIIMRLGLSGMRVNEISTLTIGALHLDGSEPQIRWTGKQNRPRQMSPGARLVEALRRYLTAYTDGLGRPLPASAPLICRQPNGSGAYRYNRLLWGRGFSDPRSSIHRLVTLRADAAALGHVAPHDLRRTAAGLLHRATDDSGAHFFDLLDIQRVLGHSDPATTMKHYLDPMDTGVHRRAARVLDG